MKARLVYHTKDVDENGDIIEIKIWEVPPSEDKPHGFKYSLAYIHGNERVIGYDNSEHKGDHKHIEDEEIPYEFKSIDKLFEDFEKDIVEFRRKKNEDQKHKNRNKDQKGGL